jgi:hypothetical protein
MAVAIGLALRLFHRGIAEVNLIREHREHKAAKAPVAAREVFQFTPAVRKAAVRAASLSCIGLLIVFFVSYRGIIEEKQKLEQVISARPEISLPIGSFSYERIQQVQLELEQKLRALDLIIDQRVFWTDKLNEIPRLIPEGVWLTNLSFNDEFSQNSGIQRRLTIRGSAYHRNPVQEIAIVTRFAADLKQSQKFARGFAEIQLESMDSAQIQGKPIKNFTIICLVR